MRTLCLFFSFCPWAYATSRLTGMLKYLSIGVSVFNNVILKSLLADCQRLQYLEAQAESTDDTEEHACTWLHAAVLHTRDIRLIGSHALSQFLLGDLLALPCIADNLTDTIGVGLLAECLTLWCSHLSVAFVHHGVNAHYVISFLHSIPFLFVLPC